MSQNYPYRKPPSDTDLRTDPGPYRSVDYRHSSADRDFYRQPQDSFSVSSSCPSSSRGSGVLQSSQDNVLSILSSCGLEPSDLALLAELPEDVLTIESLPHILRQIKCKKGTVKPFPPRAPSPSSSSSYPPSSTHRSTTSSSSSRDWDQLHRTSVQYPLDHLPPPPPPSEQLMDRWNNPITVSSGRAELPPSSSLSSSLGYTVDFHRRQGPSDYGKAGPVPSYSPARRGDRAPSSRFSEAGPADYRSSALVTASPLPSEHQSKPLASRRDTSSTRSSQSSPSMPTRKEALDFHGKVPPLFPYSCSLCDITVLSQKVWIQHVTGRHHADGQLSLLQQFPNWDCRMQTVRRDDKSEKKKKDGGKGAPAASQTSQSNSKSKQKKVKKTLEKGKVVCIKFPSQSVDEKYLRKLAEPFGKIIKVIMFPSLGFVEMGSVDQAKDLVKFHSNYPPTVNGEQIEFSVSNAFNFLQSSRVVSFTPAPSGEDGKSDLINIIKRFGPPLYTLFLPSMVFVEMKNAPDAQKLVDYYLSNTLRINSDLICVSFSGEYKTLMRVSKAKRYEEENESTKKSTTKRTRSSSRDRTTENKKRRSRSRDKASKEERTRTRSRSRDKSKEKSSRDAKTRSRSQDKLDRKRKSRSRSRDKSTSEKRTKTRSKSGSREKTKEKSNKESKKGSQETKPDKSSEKSNRDQKTRSASRDKSSRETKTKSTTQEKSSKERKSRSKSRSVEKSSRDKKSRSRERSSNKSSRRDGEKTAEPEKPDAESTSKGQPSPLEDSKPEVSNTEEVEGEAALPGEESDIEGMEVIAEDGENLADDDEEALQEEEKKESPKERAPEKDEVKEVIGGEPGIEEKPASEKEIKKEEKEEVEESKEATETPLQEDLEDFPVDLENCITLDELEDDSDDQGGESADEPKSTSKSSRVFYFGHLPPNYALFDFFQLLRNFGKVVRYYLIGNRREGFIEMSSSSAALKAVEELVSKPAIHNCPKLKARISTKYYRLDNGWVVHSDGSDDKDSRGRKREKRSKSKTSDQDETNRRSKGRKESPKKTSEKSGKKTPEKDSGSKKPPEKDSSGKKTPKKESTSKTSPEKDAKNTLETKSTGKKTPEKDLPSKKTSGKDSTTKKTPAKKSASRKTLENKSTFRETSEEESKKSPKRESLDKEPPEKVLKNGPEKESAGRKTPEKGSSCAEIPDSETLEPKGAPDNNSVPQTTVKKELKQENTQQNEEPAVDKAPPEKDYIKKETPHTVKQEEQETPIDVCMEAGPNVKDAESPDPPVSSTEPSKPPPEQDAKPQFEPAEGAAEPQKPTKPVGTEFVRPVVGYFCNLCQRIFAEEDEAKQQHCSSLSHYSKYQEKTGRDPWTS